MVYWANWCSPPTNDFTQNQKLLILYGAVTEANVMQAHPKIPGAKSIADQLPPQAIIRDRDTFINIAEASKGSSLNERDNLKGKNG